MTRKEAILSVGMGPGQLDFIARLKEQGNTVVAFGKGANSREAVEICDYSAEIDTRDFDGAVAWIDSLPVKIMAVGSFAGGMAVKTSQKLSNHYGVCTAVPDDLIVDSSKIDQQVLYERLGLSSIKTWDRSVISVDDIKRLPDDTRFISKPSVGRGSEGITTYDKKELLDAIASDTIDNDHVIQTIREGREYRCLIMVQNGKMVLLAPVLRRSYRDTSFLGILSYSERDIDRLRPFFDSFTEKCELVNTIIKVDVIVSDDSIDVIEMDIGVGGGFYFKKFISGVYGRDLMDEYINLITDRKVESFSVSKPMLRMDYVFNRLNRPIKYDLDKCKKTFDDKLGQNEILVNRLHPEIKGGFASNSDFIFTVIYEGDGTMNDFLADDIANSGLFDIG